MRYAVILAGGSGTRLWPLSRRRAPKQVHALLDTETLLQETYRRLRGLFPIDCTYISTLAAHAAEIRRQLPDIPTHQYVIEPMSRSTAAAIGFVAHRLRSIDADAVFVTMNADAYVRDVPTYLQAIDVAMGIVERGEHDLVLIGVPPTYPETGYGYLEVESETMSAPFTPVPVLRFIEKPDAVTARAFVASGRYLWNPALFVCRAARLLDRFAEHLPVHAEALASLGAHPDDTALARAFLAMPSTSIDYGLMEQCTDLVVVPASFGWADVGSWRAVHEILADERTASDVVRGMHIGVGGSGNLIVAPDGKLVATCGLMDCIVIDTPDALLICPRDRAQEVKQVVEELERRGLTGYL